MNTKTEQELVDKFIKENTIEEKDFVTPRKKQTLPTGYILDSKKVVHPHYSYYDPESESNFHIWAEDRIYCWELKLKLDTLAWVKALLRLECVTLFPRSCM